MHRVEGVESSPVQKPEGPNTYDLKIRLSPSGNTGGGCGGPLFLSLLSADKGAGLVGVFLTTAAAPWSFP